MFFLANFKIITAEIYTNFVKKSAVPYLLLLILNATRQTKTGGLHRERNEDYFGISTLTKGAEEIMPQKTRQIMLIFNEKAKRTKIFTTFVAEKGHINSGTSMKSIDSSMTSTLLSLSLFQGLTREELMDILTKTRLEFVNLKDSYVLRQGDRHEQVFFIISGNVVREYKDPEGRFTFCEPVCGDIIEASSLFGRDTTLRASYRAEGNVTLMKFDKRYLFNVFNHFAIVQLNILNSLCASTQASEEKTFISSGKNIGTSLYQFVTGLSLYHEGAKTLEITRVDLADLLGCNRRAMSDLMTQWDERGIIVIGYRQFIIPSLETLKKIIG